MQKTLSVESKASHLPPASTMATRARIRDGNDISRVAGRDRRHGCGGAAVIGTGKSRTDAAVAAGVVAAATDDDDDADDADDDGDDGGRR
jgi:hypothetical protein